MALGIEIIRRASWVLAGSAMIGWAFASPTLAQETGAEGESPAGGWHEISDGAGATIEIFRDEFGVPHVYAPSERALWFGQGYAAAEDRLWQMEVFRRDARGRLAETGLWRFHEGVSREDVIEHDRIERRNRPTAREFAYKLRWLRPEIVGPIEAYAAGVNAYIGVASEGGGLPGEFARHGIEAEPWTPADTLAIEDMALARLGSGGWEAGVALEVRDRLVEQHGEEAGARLFNEVFFFGDPEARVTYSGRDQAFSGGFSDPASKGENGLEPGWTDLGLTRTITRERETTLRLARALGLLADWGAPQWAIGGGRTRSGAPMLFGTFGAGFGSVATVHEIHLGSPLAARGIAIPGVPGLLMGANERVAWAFDSGRGHNTDYYIEMLDEELPTRYVFVGSWFDMQVIEDVIKVWAPGGAIEEIAAPIRRTRHGPVVAFSRDMRQALTVRREWWQSWGVTLSQHLIELTRAGSADDVAEAAHGFLSSHNLILADSFGSIGWEWVGRYPVFPPDHDSRLPSLGIGLDDWVGSIVFASMPKIWNPQRDLVFTWNNKPSRLWYSWFGSIFWGNAIEAALESARDVTLEDMAEIARRGFEADSTAAALRPYAARIENYPSARSHPAGPEALRAMRAYDLNRARGSLGKALYRGFAQALLDEVFEDEFGELRRAIAEQGAAASEILERGLGGLLMRVLRNDRRAGQSLETDYLGGLTVENACARALVAALDALTERHGEDLATWGQDDTAAGGLAGAIHHPLGQNTYIQIVELGDPINAMNLLAPGQSGLAGSPHATDQAARLAEMDLKPMTLDRPER